MSSFYENYAEPSWLDTIRPIHAGTEQCSPGHTFGPAVRSHYLIHFVLSGKGVFRTAAGSYTLRAEDLFIIHPGEVTTYTADASQPWHYSWIGFSSEEEPTFLQPSVWRQFPAQPIFRHIDRVSRISRTGSASSLYAPLYELMDVFLQTSPAAEQSRSSPTAYVKNFIDSNYMTRLDIQAMADSLHMDRRYMTRRFRDTYGLSPRAYLTQVRMTKAREFLRAGHSVTETAVMVGCQDLSDFSRKYKSCCGHSPSQELLPDRRRL